MEEKLKILLCEDDENLGMLLREYLQAKGYDADLCPDGGEGYKAFLKNKYDLCVLDVMMPKKDGYQAVKEIRKVKDVPVLMLSARGEEFDKLIGFDLGIDDYVTKPFSPKELVARVKAIIKRNEKSGSKLEFGGLVVDDLAHEVRVDNKVVNFTPKEYDLLKYLVANNHIALSREQLLTNIWGYDFYGDDRTVDTHVKTLRHQLGKYGNLIKTVRKVGYKFEY